MKRNLEQERAGVGNHLILLPRTIYVHNRPKTVMAKAKKKKIEIWITPQNDKRKLPCEPN